MPEPATTPAAAEGAPRTALSRFASVGYEGPDHLGLRTLCEHRSPSGRSRVISEPGRALDARDVEQVSGCPVVAVIDHTPGVARIIDAGVFMHRHQRLREFTQLRTWLTPETATQETPCTPRD